VTLHDNGHSRFFLTRSPTARQLRFCTASHHDPAQLRLCPPFSKQPSTHVVVGVVGATTSSEARRSSCASANRIVETASRAINLTQTDQHTTIQSLPFCSLRHARNEPAVRRSPRAAAIKCDSIESLTVHISRSQYKPQPFG